MKKLLSSLVVLLLLVGCCLIAAFPASATDVNYDDYFVVDGMIVEYTGTTEAEIVVPAEDADGNPITSIDQRAFRNHEELTSVVISEGIESIGVEAFEDCKNLTELSLPYSLTDAGYSAFRHTSLYTLTIPGQLSKIPSDFAVANQTLCELYISPGVNEITPHSFYMVVSEIIFPESVYLIGGIFWNMVPVTVKDASIYILNGDCELGTLSNKDRFYDQYGSPAPIVAPSAGQMNIKIYGPRDSEVKDYVNTSMSNMQYGKARFFPLDADEIAELEAKAEENGITEPRTDKTEDPTDPDKDGGDKGGDKDKDKDDAGASKSNGDNTTLIIIIVAVGALFLLIIAAVIVILVVMNNKKKKKKKKKKAVKKVVEAPVEEVEATEEVAEEKGEEE